MVRYLRRLAGKPISLDVGVKRYHGRVEIETNPAPHIKNKYFFRTKENKRIPIFHYGNRRVIMRDGGLVQLVTKE